MNKMMGAILVGAMLTPIGSNISKFKSKEVNNEISEVLSYAGQELQQQEQDSHQLKIKSLVPQIKEPIILGDLNQSNVAITIDDGYGKESLEYMLDLFEKNNVKATFFVIGECLKLYPSLWKRAVDQGHEICNHTQTHSKYFKTGNEAERFEKELLGWENVVKDVLGEEYFAKMKRDFPFFRFPGMHGIRVKAYLDILKKHGYIPIGWRHTKNPESGNIGNGDIFLWHFKNQDTLNARKNLEMILREGKHPKKVSDIITSEGYSEPIGWHNVYKKKNEARGQ